MFQPTAIGRWYPTPDKLGSAKDIREVLKQVLDQHYSLLDRFNALRASQTATTASPMQGPADTMLLGLRVAPVDTQTLADGATLKFSKKNGNFFFG